MGGVVGCDVVFWYYVVDVDVVDCFVVDVGVEMVVYFDEVIVVLMVIEGMLFCDVVFDCIGCGCCIYVC